MTIQKLIFSDVRKDRIARHLVVWGLFCLFCFYTNIEVESVKEFKMLSTYEISLMRVVCFLPVYIFIAYFFSYVLVPKFIQTKRYFLFALAGIATIMFSFAVNIFSSNVFVHFAYPDLDPGKLAVWDFLIDWNMTVQRGIGVAGGSTCIILAKGWYLQQIENTRLAKQEAENRTWLLKSQIQPEFLFHSLQTMYRKINTSADDASKMILQLSDIFSYILYDCNEEYILLEKELIAVQHLITAESMNDQKTTKITLHITGNYDDKYIMPLTLFSFLRNQIDKKADRGFIDISINIEDTRLALVLQLKNLPANYKAAAGENGITEKTGGNMPSNFLAYEMKINLPENNYAIMATVEIADIATVKKIKHHMIIAAR